jgi:hypothetical protein
MWGQEDELALQRRLVDGKVTAFADLAKTFLDPTDQMARSEKYARKSAKLELRQRTLTFLPRNKAWLPESVLADFLRGQLKWPMGCERIE